MPALPPVRTAKPVQLDLMPLSSGLSDHLGRAHGRTLKEGSSEGVTNSANGFGAIRHSAR
jgi:hypothetical protein